MHFSDLGILNFFPVIIDDLKDSDGESDNDFTYSNRLVQGGPTRKFRLASKVFLDLLTIKNNS